jgi:hypothetical protein
MNPRLWIALSLPGSYPQLTRGEGCTLLRQTLRKRRAGGHMDRPVNPRGSNNPETLPLGAFQNPAENLTAAATKSRQAQVTTLIEDGQMALLRGCAMEAHAKRLAVLLGRDGKSGHARCADPW